MYKEATLDNSAPVSRSLTSSLAFQNVKKNRDVRLLTWCCNAESHEKSAQQNFRQKSTRHNDEGRTIKLHLIRSKYWDPGCETHLFFFYYPPCCYSDPSDTTWAEQLNPRDCVDVLSKSCWWDSGGGIFSCNLNRSPNCWCRGRSTHTIFYSGRYFFSCTSLFIHFLHYIIRWRGTTKKQYVIRIKCMGHERLVNDSFNPNRSERIGKRERHFGFTCFIIIKTFFVSVEYILSSSIWRENKTAVQQGVVVLRWGCYGSGPF